MRNKYIAFIVSCSMVLAFAAVAHASVSTDFESFTPGSVNGQDGWVSTGSYDDAVVANTYGFASFGTQSFRISDAITSGSFGDWVFAKPTANAAGEASSTAGAFSIGTLQSHYELQFDIASASSSVQQAGLHLSVSPDRGDGSRMSYLRFEDGATGIDVFFDDVQGSTTPANFVETQIATGLDRTVAHTVKLTIDFVEGDSNDVVKVYIDGSLVTTGTSWENYYRFDSEAAAEQTPRIVNTAIFQARGTATPADSGYGFLIDNVSIDTSTPTPPAPPAPPVVTPSVPTCSSSQHLDNNNSCVDNGGGGWSGGCSTYAAGQLPSWGIVPCVAQGPGQVSVAPNGNPQIPATTTPPVAICTPLLSSYLRFGDTGAQVMSLQTFLNAKAGATLPVTGWFGPLTRAAVGAFQTQYASEILAPWNLTSPTGYVGKTTEAKINAVNCK